MAKKSGGRSPKRGNAKKPVAKSKKKTGRRWALRVGLVVAGGFLAGIGLVLLFWALELPDVDETLAAHRPPIVTILDRNGTRVASVGGTGGGWVDGEDLPSVLVDAVLAIEDRRFHAHGGVDAWGILRAFFANIRAGDFVQGGSTITQQLAKNMFLTPDRTAKRKVQEIMLAYGLERRLDKDEILEQYLNRVYFGSGAYGIDAAARRYFGVEVGQLTLTQSAMLAGLLKAPSRYSPANDPAAAEARMQLVLDAMVEAGTLAPSRRAMISAVPAVRPASGNSTQYFVDWVMDLLPDFIGEPAQDTTILTTLDASMQAAAEAALKAALDESGASRKIGQGALLAMSVDGGVRAMVGGSDYQKSEYNRAVRALRQPGSAFKLFVYLAALEAGMTPGSKFRDSPFVYQGWRPQNYGGGYAGSVTLQTAFAKSINTVAVKAAEAADRSQVIRMARRLGITTKIVTEPSLALGTSEVRLIDLTGAYAVVANGGRAVMPHGIAEIRNASGGVLFRRTVSRDPVLSPQVARQMDGLLRSVIDWGTGRAARLDQRSAAGKTGTSQSWRDAWFMGYSGDLVAGVWLGNDDSSSMEKVTGGSVPARVWRDFMTRTSR
ncbi:MAG: transglycosylase domain-containing protein [Alphaproteobacteria bacterium]